MYDADQPITRRDEDCLGRSQFAISLARCLLSTNDPDSMVIGLYGSWGAGKTSVINLIVEELKIASSNMLEAEQPIILNFSPWSYSGQQQMIYSFFCRLSSVLLEAPNLQDKERIIELLERYVSFFTEKPIPVTLAPKQKWYQRFISRKQTTGWDAGRDLTQVKAELNNLLLLQPNRIIIIIDNISRLYDHEIKQILQIVKSIGNFTHTSYLLALDKDRIIDAIDHLDGSGGKELLEKVVQLPFDIPAISAQDLEPIFIDRLKHVMAQIPADAWDTEYWADLYYGSLKHFFHNCRDITRYVNTLNFSYGRLRELVNPVDYCALTAIEIFMPNLYAGIRDNKDLFTDLMDHVYLKNKAEKHEEKARLDEIIAREEDYPRDMILNLIVRLFPRLRYLYETNTETYHSPAAARAMKRICSPDVFDLYFRLSLQSSNIHEREFQTILSLAKNSIEFDHALTRLNQDDRMLRFLSLFDQKTIASIPKENIPAIVDALIDDGDLFPANPAAGMLSLNTPMRIHRILHALLQQIMPKEKRFEIMKHAILHATKSIYIIVHELREQQREHTEHEDTYVPVEFRDFTIEQLSELKLACVEQIKKWAEHGQLVNYPYLLPVLYAWRDWGSSADCKAYVEKLTDNDIGLVNFLGVTLSDAIDEASTSYEKSKSWERNLLTIQDFILPANLCAHAEILFTDGYFEKLREREQLAILIFLDLMKSDTIKQVGKTTAD